MAEVSSGHFAFNRTSMESKRVTSIHASRISPFNRTSMESKHNFKASPLHTYTPFNRTSMESKHYLYQTTETQMDSFNRTSMESKQFCFDFDSFAYLLIEPVWNRN